jgi:hypothetical protein
MKKLLAALILAFVASSALAQAVTPPVCVKATGPLPNPVAITITFPTPTLNVDGTPITLPLSYQVYMGTASDAEQPLGTPLTTGSPITVNTGMTSGQTYYFRVGVLDSAGAGALSPEACIILPASVPAGIVSLTLAVAP